MDLTEPVLPQAGLELDQVGLVLIEYGDALAERGLQRLPRLIGRGHDQRRVLGQRRAFRSVQHRHDLEDAGFVIAPHRQDAIREWKPLAAEQEEVGEDEVLDRVQDLRVADVGIVDPELVFSRLARDVGAELPHLLDPGPFGQLRRIDGLAAERAHDRAVQPVVDDHLRVVGHVAQVGAGNPDAHHLAGVIAPVVILGIAVAGDGHDARVGLVDVIDLKERGDGDFPIAGQHLAEMPNLGGVVVGPGLEMPRDRLADEGLERLGVGIHGDEHEPVPGPDTHLGQVHLIVADIGKVPAARDPLQTAVEPVLPIVEGTGDVRAAERIMRADQTGAAMHAHIVERPDPVLRADQ